MAAGYVSLLKELWMGGKSCIAPLDLKRMVAKRNSQFQGFAQHDSQVCATTGSMEVSGVLPVMKRARTISLCFIELVWILLWAELNSGRGQTCGWVGVVWQCCPKCDHCLCWIPEVQSLFVLDILRRVLTVFRVFVCMRIRCVSITIRRCFYASSTLSTRT